MSENKQKYFFVEIREIYVLKRDNNNSIKDKENILFNKGRLLCNCNGGLNMCLIKKYLYYKVNLKYLK